MGESQPTLEMALWRDTRNSAPTSETVPKTCYSSIQKLATRASRMAYRALLHDPSRGHIRSGGEVCSRRKLQTPLAATDSTGCRKRRITQFASTHAASAMERLR